MPMKMLNAETLMGNRPLGLVTERLPNGYWEAWRRDDVDPEGYPKGCGHTEDEAVEDLMAELADREEHAPQASVREALEVPRKLCCGVLASVPCRCGKEWERDE